MSSTLTSFRFRRLSSWKGMSLPVTRSIATASASSTNDLVPSLMHCRPSQPSSDRVRTKYCTNVRQLLHEIRILLAHIFGISTEHAHSGVIEFMYLQYTVKRNPQRLNGQRYLCTFSIVLILACKALSFEPIKDFTDGLGRLGQHRLERNTRCQFAPFTQVVDAAVQQSWYHEVIRR